MQGTPPLISVIVAVRNASASMQSLLDSYSSQSYLDRELIVIDGASTDGTLDLLRTFKHPMALVSESDVGIADAWNKGIRLAKGDWICFLGADDRFSSPAALANIAPYLAEAERRQVAYVYSSLDLLARDGSLVGRQSMAMDFRRSVFIPSHPGSMHHHSLFQGQGFDPSYKVCPDLEFLFRTLSSRTALFVPQVTVAAYRLGGLTGGGRKLERAKESEAWKAVREHGIPFPRWRLEVHYAVYRTRNLVWGVLGPRKARRVTNLVRSLLGLPRIWDGDQPPRQS